MMVMTEQRRMRQHYHFMPEKGWMNDPNGLVYFKGQYHFFHQYYPHEPSWHSMHWGHAVSDDLLHWKYLPIALAPDQWYDDHPQGGCFSGSAIVHEDRLYVVYTGSADFGEGMMQTQCIAVSDDGIVFEKYENNPIIVPPKGYDTTLFRDPKIWKHEDVFYIIVGTSRHEQGQALLYRSDNLRDWEFVNVLAESRGELGFMWECPDIYSLGDKYVLMFSPMGTGDRKTIYMTGEMDYESGKFHYTNIGEIDWGMDYYAPQSFLAPDGRRLIVGWANEWDWMPWFKDFGPTAKEGWCGSFNLIRQAEIHPDGTLSFRPIEEYKQLRCELYQEEEFTIEEEQYLFPAGDGTVFEAKVVIELEQTTADSFSLILRKKDEEFTEIIFDISHGELRFDRNESDGWSQGISRSPLIIPDKKRMEIHIFVDQSSIEIFTDNYRTVHSGNVFADSAHNQNGIEVRDGQVYIKKLQSWRLQRATF